MTLGVRLTDAASRINWLLRLVPQEVDMSVSRVSVPTHKDSFSLVPVALRLALLESLRASIHSHSLKDAGQCTQRLSRTIAFIIVGELTAAQEVQAVTIPSPLFIFNMSTSHTRVCCMFLRLAHGALSSMRSEKADAHTTFHSCCAPRSQRDRSRSLDKERKRRPNVRAAFAKERSSDAI